MPKRGERMERVIELPQRNDWAATDWSNFEETLEVTLDARQGVTAHVSDEGRCLTLGSYGRVVARVRVENGKLVLEV
jgi:hypothetical protein